MCTYIVESTELSGSAKGAQGWFKLEHATVAYDHPSHARDEHALMIDFVGGSSRVGVELGLEAAEELMDVIGAALERAKAYERKVAIA